MSNNKKLYIFLILLPIIDLLTSISTRLFNLTVSIGVIVKLLFLAIMLITLIFSISKYKKKGLIYILLIFIYMLAYILSKIKYLTMSMFIKESIYMFKTMYFPILLVCLLCFFDEHKFDKEKIIKILIINFITYGILLFLPLITNTGFSTYNYKGYKGSSGWFNSANEISVILTLLYPFLLTKVNKSKFNIILIIFMILMIFSLGTKVSVLGIIITTTIILVLSLIKKKKKTTLKIGFILLGIILLILNSSTLNNVKYNIPKDPKKLKNVKVKPEPPRKDPVTEQEKNERFLEEEYGRIRKEIEKEDKLNNDSKLVKQIKKYGRIMLSSRDIYFRLTYEIYSKHFNTKVLLLGIGYSNTTEIKHYAITKLIEIDILDIFFHSGLIALILVLLPFIYYLIKLIQSRKLNINTIFYTLMIGLILSISCISGHTLAAPAVSIYIILYLLLAMNEINLLNKKDNKIKKNKVSIYALHLNYGGVEKNICTKANILSEIHDVEIISLYKLKDKPDFKLNDNIKVKYLTTNIKPNRKELKEALYSKNIINIIKQGLYSIKVLYLKHTLITKSMINCNSEIIISTRIDFTEKLIRNNEYNNIKIAEEHIYHNNNTKYLNKLYYILKSIDYLMPSSNYLTNYYKELFTEYRYKIKTNNMPIESDNKISNLKNKNIITVGRLEKVKGYDDLIKLFSKLDNKEWTLSIAGTGSEYDNLNNLIKELNMEDNIKLLGFKNTEELNKIYKESSLYIMTSIEESFGLVLLEAASHGLPLIAYDSALGAKEIIKDNGILIKNRNEKEMIKELKNLINDEKLRKEYQKKSLSISKQYDYDLIKVENINFFKNISHNNIYTNLYINNKKECYNLIENKLKNKEKEFIITANPETYMLSRKDSEISDMLYNKNNLVVPDGISIVKTSNILGYSIKERITGVDLAEYLFELANKNKYKVYLFGASEDVIDKLTGIINTKYPNINLVGGTNGYMKDKDGVMNYIKTTNPDIVMLALGIPLQEKLINRHINDFKKGIFIGVGGSFDVLSGTKKRAPRIFIKLNLEWLYRIASEPKRITRFIKHNIKYLIVILKEKINRNVDNK